MAEGGRLLHYTGEDDTERTECGILITSLETRDQGRWTCNVGVVENSEVTTASGMANITIATPPEAITLEPLMWQMETVNVTAGTTYEILCLVENARPAPTFNWSLSDETLIGGKDAVNGSDSSNTLTFIPKLENANQAIRCTVNHPGLSQPLISETVLVVIGGEDIIPPQVGMATGSVVGVVVVVLVVVVLLAVLVGLYKTKYMKAATTILEDNVEKGEEEKAITEVEAEGSSQTESEAHEAANKEELEKKENKSGRSLQTKITSFFISLKSKDKRLDETQATEWEKVDLDETKMGGEEEKKDSEKVEKVDKGKFGDRFSSLLAKFKSTDKKEDNEDMKETEEEEKVEEVVNNISEEKEGEKVEEVVKRVGSETPV